MKKIFTLFAALTCMVSMFAAKETVYFVNANDVPGEITVHLWGGTAAETNWPGVAATKEAEQIGGHDVWSYTAEAGAYANVIFTNKKTGNYQTSDLKWTAGKYYVKDGWYTKEEAAAKLGQPVEYESVYFVNVDGWSNVKIYTWSSEIATWPGVDMKKEAEKIADTEVWSYTVEKGTAFGGMLFNNGEGTQTGDLTWTAGKYYVKDGWYTKEEAAAKLAGGVPSTPAAYYVVGSFNAWTNPDPETAMVAEGNLYTKTLSLVAGECQLKVTNGTWDDGCNWGYDALSEVPAGVTKNNDGNIVFTLAEAGDVVVTFNGSNVTVAGNFVVSSEPVVVTYVLLGVGGDWTTGIALTQNPDNEKEYMLLGQTISEGDAVKVVTLTNGVATAWCGKVEEGCPVERTEDDMGNILLTPGIYDFYYKTDADVLWIAVSNGTTPTDNVNVIVDGKVVKVLYNGQMCILRDGVMYNAVGQVIK